MTYGSRLNPREMSAVLDHVLTENMSAERMEAGIKPTPICIWGEHGLGKTDMVHQYAQDKGWKFVTIAPAQFEEMGDFHGLPEIRDAAPAHPMMEGVHHQTVFAPPAWVPTQEGPGILLIDDINRADDRILRGLMQLLQNFEMFSWKLPKRWQIVATANPEGGDYSVTPMDDAMLTRMLHMQMAFDAKVWAQWASRSGVDPRGISFVLSYPEMMTGKRTTPRSLTQFFAQIKGIANLKERATLVTALASSALDDVTVATFMSFVADQLAQLIDPEEILNAPNFAPIAQRFAKLADGGEGAKRVDRIATVCTRLYLAMTHKDYKPEPMHGRNLVEFMLLEAMPTDLLLSLHGDLQQEGSRAVKEMLQDIRLAERMLKGMA